MVSISILKKNRANANRKFQDALLDLWKSGAMPSNDGNDGSRKWYYFSAENLKTLFSTAGVNIDLNLIRNSLKTMGSNLKLDYHQVGQAKLYRLLEFQGTQFLRVPDEFPMMSWRLVRIISTRLYMIYGPTPMMRVNWNPRAMNWSVTNVWKKWLWRMQMWEMIVDMNFLINSVKEYWTKEALPWFTRRWSLGRHIW